MGGTRHRIYLLITACLLAVGLETTSAQSTNRVVAISRAGGNCVVSWTNRGTLQSATVLQGAWRDVLGASNPLTFTPTNAQELFRVISRWGTRSNLLEANSEMSVAELDGRIYVMGGYPSSRVTQRTVQVYDSTQDRWHYTTPLPIPLNHAMPATANGRVYIIGGQTNSTGTSGFVNTVFEYNPLTSNWTARAPMPTARSAGAAAVIGNLIYVAGGRSSTTAQDFAVYDAVSNQWRTLADLPTGRNHLAAAAIDGLVYVAGGRLGPGFSDPMTAALEVYDPVAGTWATRAPLPAPRGGVNGIAVDGCFFVFGGEGPNGIFDAHEMYVASMNRWFRLEALPIAVHGVTGAAFLDGWIHLPGGGTAVGGSSGSTIHQVFWLGGICP
jgi:N-acetylneuraminic acid mutarotase